MVFRFIRDTNCRECFYSVGRHNSTRVAEGREIADFFSRDENEGTYRSGGGGRRDYFVTVSDIRLGSEEEEENGRG